MASDERDPLQTFCVEDKTFSAEYHDPEKRFIGNALTITLNDGTVLDEVVSRPLIDTVTVARAYTVQRAQHIDYREITFIPVLRLVS